MAQVKLFGGLRSHVDIHSLDVPGATVGQILDHLCLNRSELRAAIFQGDVLAPHVRVMVNGRDVELDLGLETPVSDDDQLAVFPPIAGG
jgi:molybdopterin synthase sulfur carrier subunit